MKQRNGGPQLLGSSLQNHADQRQQLTGKAEKSARLSLDRQLILDVQHLALDQDCYVNKMIEEAAKDLLKKYREKSK